MPFLAAGDKQPLLDEQLSLRNTQVTWGAIGVLSLPLGAHVLFLPNVISGVMVAILKRQENAVDRALADPPRTDYATPTRARPRRYISGQLGNDALAVAADRVAVVTLRVTAYLDAMVRADERAQGAAAVSRSDLERQRLVEASRMLEGFRATSWLLSESLETLSLAFAGFSQRPEVEAASVTLHQPTDGRAVSVLETMAPRARAALKATGLVIHDLDLLVAVSRFPETLADGAIEVARETLRLGSTARQAAAVLKPARPVAAEADEHAPGLGSRVSELGDAALPRGAGTIGREAYEQAAAEGDPRVAIRVGFLELEQGNLARARAWFERSAAAGNAQAQRQLGLLLLGEGDVSASESALREALDRGDTEAAVDLAALLVQVGRLDEAEAMYTVALNGGSPAAALGLALLAMERGDREHATRLLRRANELAAKRLPEGESTPD